MVGIVALCCVIPPGDCKFMVTATLRHDRNRLMGSNAGLVRGGKMTRRRPRTITRRPISAAEVAALAGIELDPRPLEFEDDGRGEWSIPEHSQLKRQWRWVRRASVIVQIIIALFGPTWFMLWFFATWLVVGGLTMPHP
jgi:hypothetical protein